MRIARDPAVAGLIKTFDATIEAAIGKRLHVGIVELPPKDLVADILSQFQETQTQKDIARICADATRGVPEQSPFEYLDHVLRSITIDMKVDPLEWTLPVGVHIDHERIGRLRSDIVPRCCDACEQRRKDDLGDFKCWWSDLKNGWLAFSKGRDTPNPRVYMCPMSGLTEIAAPVRLGSQPVANLYAGQFSVAAGGAQGSDVPKLTRKEQQRAIAIVGLFANVISHQYTLLNTQRILERADVTSNIARDLRESLSPFWGLIAEFVRFDGGTIWLIDHIDRNRINPKSSAVWSSNGNENASLPKGDFLPGFFVGTTTTFKVCEDISTLPADQKAKAVWRQREKSGMRSFAWLPLFWQTGDKRVFGVLELSSRQAGTFSDEDHIYLDAIASEMTTVIRTNMIVVALRKILMANDRRKLTDSVVKYIPSVVNGIGCSLFLRLHPGTGPALLVSSEGEGIRSKPGSNSGFWDAGGEGCVCPVGRHRQYEEGEGLTGWVLQTGRELNLEIHDTGIDTRDAAVRRFNEKLKSEDRAKKALLIDRWKGKRLGEMPRAHYSKRAWLGVPILSKKKADKVWGVLRVSERIEGNFSAVDVNLIRDCASIIADRLEQEAESAKHKDLLTQTIQTLSGAIDAKHEYTQKHSASVVEWSLRIFDCLSPDEQRGYDRELLRIAAMLHDIGKLRIPDSLLNTDAKYSDEWQFQALRMHPTYGERILDSLRADGMKAVRDAVVQHHENMLGTGYPGGRKGEDIHLFARIIAVADSFHAITTRSYQVGAQRTEEEALIEIKRNEYKGQRGVFDLSVLQAFEKAFHLLRMPVDVRASRQRSERRTLDAGRVGGMPKKRE